MARWNADLFVAIRSNDTVTLITLWVTVRGSIDKAFCDEISQTKNTLYTLHIMQFFIWGPLSDLMSFSAPVEPNKSFSIPHFIAFSKLLFLSCCALNAALSHCVGYVHHDICGTLLTTSIVSLVVSGNGHPRNSCSPSNVSFSFTDKISLPSATNSVVDQRWVLGLSGGGYWLQ